MSDIHLLLAFLVSLAVIIALVMSKRFNPSLCLFIGAIVAAFIGKVPLAKIASIFNSSFGAILVSTGILMVFAFTFSQYLNESGGVTEFAKALVRKVGPKYDLIALALVGYILAIPVGLLASCAIVIPMFKPMSKLTGRPIPAYLCAFVVPTLLTACTVVPTSGPVLFAGLLGIDIGFFMVYGIIITLPAAVVSTVFAYWLSNRYKKKGLTVADNTEAIDLTADPTKPGAGLVLALILIPIVIITLGSFAPYFTAEESFLRGFLTFVGNPGISMFIITLVSIRLCSGPPHAHGAGSAYLVALGSFSIWSSSGITPWICTSTPMLFAIRTTSSQASGSSSAATSSRSALRLSCHKSRNCVFFSRGRSCARYWRAESRQLPILLCTRILAVRISCCRVISAIFSATRWTCVIISSSSRFCSASFSRSSCSSVTSVALI